MNVSVHVCEQMSAVVHYLGICKQSNVSVHTCIFCIVCVRLCACVHVYICMYIHVLYMNVGVQTSRNKTTPPKKQQKKTQPHTAQVYQRDRRFHELIYSRAHVALGSHRIEKKQNNTTTHLRKSIKGIAVFTSSYSARITQNRARTVPLGQSISLGGLVDDVACCACMCARAADGTSTIFASERERTHTS